MRGAWLTRRTPIALDIGMRQIKAAQLAWHNRLWRLEACACVPRQRAGKPLEADEVARLAQVLQRQGFTGRKTILSVVTEHLFSDLLELPPASSGAPTEDLARMEVARLNGRAAGSFEMVCWELPPSARPREQAYVLSSALPHEQANAVLDVLEAGGLQAVAIQTAGLALERACRHLLRSDAAVQGILDLGWSAFRMSVLCHGVICYQRVLPETGLAPLAAELCTRFRVAPEHLEVFLSGMGLSGANEAAAPANPAMAAEVRSLVAAHFARCLDDIRATFDYVLGMYPGSALRGLLLAGGGAALAGEEVFAQGLGVQAHVVKPSEVIPCGRWERQYDVPGMVAAIGLAQFQENRP